MPRLATKNLVHTLLPALRVSRLRGLWLADVFKDVVSVFGVALLGAKLLQHAQYRRRRKMMMMMMMMMMMTTVMMKNMKKMKTMKNTKENKKKQKETQRKKQKKKTKKNNRRCNRRRRDRNNSSSSSSRRLETMLQQSTLMHLPSLFCDNHLPQAFPSSGQKAISSGHKGDL